MMLSMGLAAILSRIHMRLKALNISANKASKLAGKPDAIRNLQRAVKEGRRDGISTATLTALAPILQTTEAWLLTGRNSDPAQSAQDAAANGSISYEEALAALTWSFEALELGNPVECRVLARAVLRASYTPQSPQGEPLSSQQIRELVFEAIRLFRPE